MVYKIGNEVINCKFNSNKEIFSALICGGVGSGKTHFIQEFIQNTIRLNDKALIKFLIIDPKGDGTWNNIIPQKYLLGEEEGIIRFTHNHDINLHIIQTIVNKLNEVIRCRQDLFVRYGVSNLNKYNEKVSESLMLPFIYIVVDELVWLYDIGGDKYKKELTETLCKLLTKSRSAGIIPICISHRFNMLPQYVKDLVSFKVLLKTDILKNQLFNDEELEHLNLYILNYPIINNTGDFIAKVGEFKWVINKMKIEW